MAKPPKGSSSEPSQKNKDANHDNLRGVRRLGTLTEHGDSSGSEDGVPGRRAGAGTGSFRV